DPAADVKVAALHGVKHPADPHAHGQVALKAHEVSHGPADAHGHADDHAHAGQAAVDDHGGGHGHGPWHGPHESPTPMTFPLMALAVGAIVAGFVGIPAAIGGGNAIEKFLEPSFTASATVAEGAERASAERPAAAAAEGEGEGGEHVSANVERGLMALSLAIAICGILLARKFYVTSPEISERLADRWAGPHRVLSNK